MSQEKLTLEHLAAYLPYGLKMKVIDTSFYKYEIMTLCDKGGLSNIGLSNVIDEPQDFKPILRPWSDLTKEIEHNGVKFIPIQKTLRGIDEFYPIECYDQDCKWILKESFAALKHLPYEKIQNLISWHFDIFGLIPKGLAVSIHDVG